MGRKKKEKTGIMDRIGETVDFTKCPGCSEHTDCFACIDGRCTALKESGGAGCVFYKPLEKAVMENRQIYCDLREKGRSDLIRAHEGVFAALGVFDEELAESDRLSEELVTFEKTDFENTLAAAKKRRRENEDGETDNHRQPSLE